MGTIPDDMGGIFEHLREAALTMQQGGGIGYDFSTLRPKGALVHGIGADASGPLSFMDVWDAMRSEEHTSELQSLIRLSYAVFRLKKQKEHESEGIPITTPTPTGKPQRRN